MSSSADYSSGVSNDQGSKSPRKKKDPRFMKPTVNYIKPEKEVNRIKLSRAIEKVRQEQIKQSLIQNSNVS